MRSKRLDKNLTSTKSSLPLIPAGGLVSDGAKARYLQLLRHSVQRRQRLHSRTNMIGSKRHAQQPPNRSVEPGYIRSQRSSAKRAPLSRQTPVLQALQDASSTAGHHPRQAPTASAAEIFDAYVEKVQSFAVVHSARHRE